MPLKCVLVSAKHRVLLQSVLMFSDPMPKPKPIFYPNFKYNKNVFAPVVTHRIHVVVPAKPKKPKQPKMTKAIPPIGNAFLIHQNDELNMRKFQNDEFNRQKYPARSGYLGKPLFGGEPPFGLNSMSFNTDRKWYVSFQIEWPEDASLCNYESY